MPASESLARASARGVAWVFLSSAAARLVSLASLAVLARLLHPAEFGLMAAALAYVTYAETVSDLGSGMALIYWPGRRDEAAQVAFALNLVSGSAWFVLTWALAPPVAAFFRNPEEAGVLRALAWYFPLKALGATHDALLQKDLRFGARLLPEAALALVKAALAVALAWAGWGVWSLVCGHLAGVAVWTLLLWAVVPWRPRRRWPAGLLGPMLDYGRGILAVNVLAAVTHHADLVIVGRVLGTAALGFYQVAYKLPEASIAVFMWAVTRVLFPALARVQTQAGALRGWYLASLRYTSLVTLPAAAGLAVLAEPIVLVLFGAAWRPSIPLVRALAVYLGLRSLSAPAGDLLKAGGRPGLLAGLGAIKALVLLPGLVLAAGTGALAVAVTLALVTGLTLLLSLMVVGHVAGVSARATWEALRANLAGALLIGASLALWLRLSAGRPAALVLGGGLLLGAAAYALMLRAANPDAWRRLVELLRPARAARGSGSTVVGAVDRFLVPLDDGRVLARFRRDVFVPHTRLERLARRLLPARWLLRRRVRFEARGAGPGGDGRLDLIATGLAIARETLKPPAEPGWLAHCGDDFEHRRRLVLLLFEPESGNPSAVLALRGAQGTAPSLAHERDTLDRLARVLPGELRAGVPRVLGWAARDSVEGLAMSWIAGRSAYVEMQTAPGRDLARHFAAASDWLARLHLATREGTLDLGEAAARAVEALGAHGVARVPPRLAELGRKAAHVALPLAVGHGDFWARNLLLTAEGAAGVIDWEHSRARAAPFMDLFHFPLTYGQNFLWSRGRRRPPETAFRATFLEANRVSREARRYLARYCALCGIETALLPGLLHLYLAERLRADPAGAGRWLAFQRLLESAAPRETAS